MSNSLLDLSDDLPEFFKGAMNSVKLQDRASLGGFVDLHTDFDLFLIGDELNFGLFDGGLLRGARVWR